jgi:hypothetical protein
VLSESTRANILYHPRLLSSAKNAIFKACMPIIYQCTFITTVTVALLQITPLLFLLLHLSSELIPHLQRRVITLCTMITIVEEVKCELTKVGKELMKKVISPLDSRYRLELDALPKLDENRLSYFASLIGVLRWCIKLGWVDIVVEVNLLAHFQACFRAVYLEQMFHLFGYLK